MLTVITLGIIPSVGCAEVVYKVVLSEEDNQDLVSVNAGKEVKTVFGMVAWFLMLSPSWVGESAITEYEANSIVDELGGYYESIE